jgi:hypothetical protein
MMPFVMNEMHRMPHAQPRRRPACVGGTLDVAWRASLRAETAWARCGAAVVSRPRRRRRDVADPLAARARTAPARRPPGGRARGRLPR